MAIYLPAQHILTTFPLRPQSLRRAAMGPACPYLDIDIGKDVDEAYYSSDAGLSSLPDSTACSISLSPPFSFSRYGGGANSCSPSSPWTHTLLSSSSISSLLFFHSSTFANRSLSSASSFSTLDFSDSVPIRWNSHSSACSPRPRVRV